MDPALRARADERVAKAIMIAGAPDPRDSCRDRLRFLRERDEGSFRRALDYFENVLIPRVASDDSDPLSEWLEYGRVLAELGGAGRAIQVDPTGRSRDYARPVPMDHLVLHLPASGREPVRVLRLPGELSPAQRATYALLVEGSLG
jgi:hypothetical protein